MSGETEPYLIVGALLFVLGALGFFTRRNMIVMILSAELMLHGVSLTLVTFGRAHNNFEGQVFTVFILTVGACEAALALALILALYQRSKSLDIEFWTTLREPELPAPLSADTLTAPLAPPQEFPRLTPAGRVPELREPHDSNLVDDAFSPTAESPTDPPDPDDVIKTAIR
jgi:NADH-quinone oxidoreductase subunit K